MKNRNVIRTTLAFMLLTIMCFMGSNYSFAECDLVSTSYESKKGLKHFKKTEDQDCCGESYDLCEFGNDLSSCEGGMCFEVIE